MPLVYEELNKYGRYFCLSNLLAQQFHLHTQCVSRIRLFIHIHLSSLCVLFSLLRISFLFFLFFLIFLYLELQLQFIPCSVLSFSVFFYTVVVNLTDY